MPIVYEDSYFLQYHKYRVFLKNIHTYYYISCIFCVAPKKDHVESPRHWIGIDLRACKRSAVVANFPGVVSLFYLDAIVLEICSKMWYLFWIMNPTVKLGAISKRDAAFFKLHMYFCPFLVPLEKNKMAHKIWHILLANRNTVRIVWPWKTTWYKLQLSINIKLLSKKQRNIS